jgi:DNA-binding response OmpR family regulator
MLLVEDDTVHSETVEKTLQRAGHQVSAFGSGEKALRFLNATPVDLAILDWQLPGISGLDVLHWIRTKIGSELPVLFLSSKMLESDVVRALDAGADDYIIKPFRAGEILARVNVLLRRQQRTSTQGNLIAVGDYVLDPVNHAVSLRGQSLELTVKEFELVSLFFRNVGKPVSRETICVSIWGRDLEAASRSLDTHIYRLRQKLSLTPDNGVRLRAVYGSGYRFDLVCTPKETPASYPELGAGLSSLTRAVSIKGSKVAISTGIGAKS